MGERTYRVASKGKVFKPKSKRNKVYTEQCQKARQIRGSERWKQLAKMYKRRNPLCQYCRKHPAEEVHHIVPLAENPDLGYNVDNLIALCVDCHDIIHARRNRGEDVDTELKEKKKEY